MGPVASAENVSDIGAKKLGVVTMRILMNMLGVYDSEKNELVGQHEIDEKHAKQSIKLLSKKQGLSGLSSVRMIQLILASLWLQSLGPFLMDLLQVVVAI